MLNMKKDWRRACMLAPHMLMARGSLHLRVIIPAVENMTRRLLRPRDVYRSRKGLTVEIGNTDAEPPLRRRYRPRRRG
jgi:leucyl aminopeptidase